MMQKYFGKFAKELNLPFEELFSFGHTRLNPDEPFSMTILACGSVGTRMASANCTVK
jgi:hypothetical protein